MVNYCCVYGCGRNSRTSKHLYFYSVPKDLIRQQQWLKVAERLDLLEKPHAKRNMYRFCSRHFSPQSIKNKHLCADAVPSLYLPGCEAEDVSDENTDRPMHKNIGCNNCREKIVGFRYKCVTCVDFDLCARCEMAEAHEAHLMLRIPTPMKFKKVESMVKKWQQFHSEDNAEDSSDDEPIQKYAKNYDSGIDLSDDTKETIRNEIARVLNLKKPDTKKKSKSVKRTSDVDKNPKKQKKSFVDIEPFSDVPEVAFADVNEIHSNVTNQTITVKTEAPCLFPVTSGAADQDPELAVMNLKLTDDLGMIVFNHNTY